MPQIPFLDRVLQLAVVLQRRVRAVQSVQNRRFHRAVLRRRLRVPLLCVDRCRRWSRQCRKLLSFRSWCWLLDKVVDVPVLATSRVCRGSAVAVHRPVVAAHHGYDEPMRRLFRAVCTGARQGLSPAIRAGKRWRGRREFAPRRSATRI